MSSTNPQERVDAISERDRALLQFWKERDETLRGMSKKDRMFYYLDMKPALVTTTFFLTVAMIILFGLYICQWDKMEEATKGFYSTAHRIEEEQEILRKDMSAQSESVVLRMSDVQNQFTELVRDTERVKRDTLLAIEDIKKVDKARERLDKTTDSLNEQVVKFSEGLSGFFSLLEATGEMGDKEVVEPETEEVVEEPEDIGEKSIVDEQPKEPERTRQWWSLWLLRR
jgi:hypothetical protein